jgi:O-succinylbenzoic acid--CoA ligase
MELFGSLKKPDGSLTSNTEIENSIAIITPGLTLTYKQLNKKISSTVKLLNKIGLKSRDKAAILGENSSEYVILILSLWKTGAIPIPLNTRLLPDELEELVLFAGCNFVLTGNLQQGIKSIPGVSIHEFPFKEEKTENISIKKSKTSGLPGKFQMNNPALIIYTSGSAGKPKGVVISFNNLYYSALNGNILFKHRNGDRWLASLPFYHIGGFSIITRSFFYGAALIIPKTLTMDEIIYAIENLKPTLASLVTTQLKRLMEAGYRPPSNLRHILLGGGFIEAELVSAAIKQGWNAVKSYGTTETASFVTMLSTEEFKTNPLSAGKAIPPNQILIIDENKNILPNGKVGEIAIKAQSVARGYLNNEDGNKKKFAGNIFYSGDSGYLDKDGFLYIEARREDLIISGGENIIPSEVEAEIINYPGVKEVCVFGKEDEEWGHTVAAAIASAKSITVEELKKFLVDKLPSFKHPRTVFILDELPKTELGKIKKGDIINKFK